MARVTWTRALVDAMRTCRREAPTLAASYALFVRRTGEPVTFSAFRMAAYTHADRDPETGADAGADTERPTATSQDSQNVTDGSDPCKRVLIIGDVHAPKHDGLAWAVAMRAWRAFRPHIIVIMGDFADCESLSSHPPDGSATEHELPGELDGVRAALDELDSLGAERKVYVSGNHEYRLQKYLAQRAPALSGAVSLRGLLDLERRGWEWVDYRGSVTIGSLTCTHDIGSAGRYAHVLAAQKRFGSVAIGHTHRLALQWIGGSGLRIFGLCAGHLSSPEASRYAHQISTEHEWQQGFATALLCEDGTVLPRMHPIIRYTAPRRGASCEVDGTIYSIEGHG